MPIGLRRMEFWASQSHGLPIKHSIWWFASESPDHLPEKSRESLVEHQPRPNPRRNSQNLDEWKTTEVSQSENQDWVPPLPSFSILLPPSDSKTPARWVEIVPEHWSGYAAAWWSERSAWLLDGRAMSSHIRTTTGPNFYNSWCIAIGFGWGKTVLEVIIMNYHRGGGSSLSTIEHSKYPAMSPVR